MTKKKIKLNQTKPNSVGDGLNKSRGNWSFQDIDGESFERHIEKSLPGYSVGHDYIKFLSDFFISEGSTIYDIGCSTGNLISALSNYHKDKKNIKFIGVEPINGFKDKFEFNTKKISKNHEVSFLSTPAEDLQFEKCDLILSHYSMQFIKPKFRQIIFNRIFENLNWGGAVFLFEKIRGSDARFQDMLTSAYLEYKKSVGYSSDDILNKLFSLRGVLEPYSSKENHNFLKRAGFKDIEIIHRHLCFEGSLSIK